MARYGLERGRPLTFSAGRRTSEVINQRNVLRSLIVRVTGDLVITGAAGETAGNVRPDAAGRLVEQVRVIGDGQTMQDWSGRTLYLADRLFEAEELPQTLPASGAIGTTAVDIRLRIPFYMLRSLTPDQTAFPTQAVASPRIDVDWAEPAEMFTGGAAAVRLDAARVEIYEETVLGLASKNPAQFARPLVYRNEQAVTAAVTGRLLDLDFIAPGTRLRAVVIEAFSGGAGGGGFDPDSAVVDELTFRMNGQEEFSGIPFTIQQGRNKSEYALAEIQPGVAVLDFAENERTDGNQLPAVAGLQRPQLVYDATPGAGENKVRVTAICTR